MKQRLLVMNGQRLVQNEQDGKWETVKVEKAGAVKPGIYNLYLASPADKAQIYEGPILHSDKTSVYQQVRSSYISHDRTFFEKIPDIGSAPSIRYDNGKAVIGASSLKLGRKI
jgi:hypothetical protein